MSRFKTAVATLLYKSAPVKQKCFVFTSFDGHYSDNPKYVCQAMHELDPDAELIWLIDKIHAAQLPSWVAWVDIRSLRTGWIRGRAKAIIDNVYCDKSYPVFQSVRFSRTKAKLWCAIHHKKNQHAYSTWHGTPLKRMGRDQLGNDIVDFLFSPLTLFLSNKFHADIMRHITFDHPRILCLGMPRNDILFHPELREEIRGTLGLLREKKIILFAPTFRNDGKDTQGKNLRKSGIDQLKQMDFDALFEALSAKFGGEWVMVCRFHYLVANMVDWEELEKQYPGKFINGNVHDEMSEYLLCADILLTDASSCMFDFSLTGRPVFLFFPDLDHYESQERGFYLPLSKLPFPVSRDFAGLLDNISTFDEKAYTKGVAEMHEAFGDVDDGNASYRIAEYILQECGQEKG